LHRNCLLKLMIEGKIRGIRRWGRRHKQLLDDLEEERRYLKLKEEAQDHTLWRTQFGRGLGPVVRQTTAWTWTRQLNSSNRKAFNITLKSAIGWLTHRTPLLLHSVIWASQ
jgi:hypothetical protein